jgi:hypothetical protein
VAGMECSHQVQVCFLHAAESWIFLLAQSKFLTYELKVNRSRKEWMKRIIIKHRNTCICSLLDSSGSPRIPGSYAGHTEHEIGTRARSWLSRHSLSTNKIGIDGVFFSDFFFSCVPKRKSRQIIFELIN